MNEELNKINNRFKEESVGVFPFMSKTYVTVLSKGFYWKKKADYRGVSMIYDKQEQRSKALLVGFFYVPQDYIIVPHGLELTPGKQKLINDKLNEGYTLTRDFPSLKPYEFPENSEEYRVAKMVNEEYKSKSL